MSFSGKNLSFSDLIQYLIYLVMCETRYYLTKCYHNLLSLSDMFLSTGKPKAPNAAKTRQVTTKPERVLDAPDLRDDFYLHLLDWSKNNHMAVALHDTLFIWNAADGSIEELYSKQSEEEYISCVSWVNEGSYLAVGDSTALVDLYDVSCMKMMRSMQGHADRVSTLKWNNHILASGSRRGNCIAKM